jgi:two-component system, response regulator
MNEKLILLVEDNPDDADLTLRALRKDRTCSRVNVVRDGAEALEYLFGTDDEPRELPSLVLLDLNLPKVGGLEVLRRIREDERTRALPVVILTSSTEEQDLASAYRSYVNSYIRKPVDFVTFTEAVKLLGSYWLQLNEEPPRPLTSLA